jgi:hypothetical protein
MGSVSEADIRLLIFNEVEPKTICYRWRGDKRGPISHCSKAISNHRGPDRACGDPCIPVSDASVGDSEHLGSARDGVVEDRLSR